MSDAVEKKEKSFEDAMAQLEEIVHKLETGDVPLEEAIQLFQDGMNLSKICSDKLQQVEKQVQLLIEEDGVLSKKAFHIEEENM